jgi:protein-disulfide isomerase
LVPVLEQVLEQYPQQVKLVFKHFPLRNHTYAFKAAQASMAAEKQGKFWEFHDLLFKDYNRLNDQKVTEIRTSLNLDADQFQRDMQEPAIKALIDADLSNGNSAGVRGTPTVFINGKLIRDKSLKGFQQQINLELTQLNAGDKSEVKSQ